MPGLAYAELYSNPPRSAQCTVRAHAHAHAVQAVHAGDGLRPPAALSAGRAAAAAVKALRF